MIQSQFSESNSGQYKRIHQFSTNDFFSGLAGCEDDTIVTQQGALTVQSPHTTVHCECLRTVLSKSISFTFMAFEGNTRSLLIFFFLLHVKHLLLVFETPHEFIRKICFLVIYFEVNTLCNSSQARC